MYNLILLIFFIISVILVALIMFQQEKTSDIKSSFTTNTVNNLFIPKNTDNTINKSIKILATLFILISLTLNNFNSNKIKNNNWENLGNNNKILKK